MQYYKTLYNVIPFLKIHIYMYICICTCCHNEGHNTNVKDSYLWVEKIMEIFSVLCVWFVCNWQVTLFVERPFQKNSALLHLHLLNILVTK